MQRAKSTSSLKDAMTSSCPSSLPCSGHIHPRVSGKLSSYWSQWFTWSSAWGPRPFSTWSLSIYLQLVQQCHLQADFQVPVQMPHALHLWARSFMALCFLHSKLREGEEQWHRVTCVALAPGLGLNREEIYLRIPRISDGNYVTAPR